MKVWKKRKKDKAQRIGHNTLNVIFNKNSWKLKQMGNETEG
jgi:hypothetical protein